MKKRFGFLSIFVIVLSLTVSTFAEEKTNSVLTAEQQAIMDSYIDSYESISIINVEKLGQGKSSTNKLFRSSAASTTYRGTYQRGNELFMWTKDYVYWTSNGSTISSSNAEQSCGYNLPNYAEVKGITKQSYSSSSTHIYNGKKACGGKVPTPWGGVELNMQDFIDQLKANADGTLDVDEDI